MVDRIFISLFLLCGTVLSQSTYVTLNGTDAYVQTNLNFDRGVSQFTVEVWFSIDDVSSPSGTNHTILTQRGLDVSDARTFIYVEADGSIHTMLSGSAVELAPNGTINPAADDGRWFHAAMVKTGTNNDHEFYLNGSLINTVSLSYPNYIHGFKMGATNGTAVNFLDGNVDELRESIQRRTSLEIGAWWHKEIPSAGGVRNWMFHYYQLNAGSGTTDYELIFNFANMATLVGGAGWGTDPQVLPVELRSFSAIAIDNGIELKWETATEVNNYGFEVQRSAYSGQRSEFESVGFVDGAGNSNSPRVYSFVDDNPLTGTAQYRLKQVDIDGSYDYSDAVEISFINSPTEFTLDQNYPNPFNPETVISYELPVTSDVRLKIYDVLGNEIATLVNEFKEAGNHEVKFDASNLPSGMYFYTMNIGEQTFTKKMLILK